MGARGLNLIPSKTKFWCNSLVLVVCNPGEWLESLIAIVACIENDYGYIMTHVVI